MRLLLCAEDESAHKVSQGAKYYLNERMLISAVSVSDSQMLENLLSRPIIL